MLEGELFQSSRLGIRIVVVQDFSSLPLGMGNIPVRQRPIFGSKSNEAIAPMNLK